MISKRVIPLMGISVLFLLVNIPQAEANLCGDEVFLDINTTAVIPMLIFSDDGFVPFGGLFEDVVPGVDIGFDIFCDGKLFFDYDNTNSVPTDVPGLSFWWEDLMWTDKPGGKVVDFFVIVDPECQTDITTLGFNATSVHATNDEFTIPADTALFCDLQIVSASSVVGGEFIPLDTTMILVAGAQNTAAWMLPIVVSGIGIGLLVSLQKTKLKHNSCPSCKLESDDIFTLGGKTVGKCKNPKCRVSIFFVK